MAVPLNAFCKFANATAAVVTYGAPFSAQSQFCESESDLESRMLRQASQNSSANFVQKCTKVGGHVWRTGRRWPALQF